MKWQLLNDKNEPVGEHFDDGLEGSPDMEGFTTDVVKAEADKREGVVGFNYIGESTKEIKA